MLTLELTDPEAKTLLAALRWASNQFQAVSQKWAATLKAVANQLEGKLGGGMP
jgi:hypothetical protein